MKKALTITMLSALLLTNTNNITTLPTLTQIGSTLAPAVPALWPTTATALSWVALAYTQITLKNIRKNNYKISQEFHTQAYKLHDAFKSKYNSTMRSIPINGIGLDKARQTYDFNNLDEFNETPDNTPGLFITQCEPVIQQQHNDNAIRSVEQLNKDLEQYKNSYQSLKTSYQTKTHNRKLIRDVTEKLAYVPAALTMATAALTIFYPASQKYSPTLYKLASIAAGASLITSACASRYTYCQNKAADAITENAPAVGKTGRDDILPGDSATLTQTNSVSIPVDSRAALIEIIKKDDMIFHGWATEKDIDPDYMKYINQCSTEELKKRVLQIDRDKASKIGTMDARRKR